MERLGFINSEYELKVLILYVMRRLPLPIDTEGFAGLILIDGGVDYFEYKQCFFELVDSAHIEEKVPGKYALTAKGSRNGEILETSVPFSVRTKADRVIAPVAEAMLRNSMILANHEACTGGVSVYLALSDGIGNIFDLKILAADEVQAKKIEKNFKSNAEGFYNKFIDMLSE